MRKKMKGRIAIIPARGGSKRIPKKNIRLFCGKPIISYSISAARESGLFEQIIVSTDSEEIAGIARDFGAEVPFLRSRENSGDTATMSDVLTEVLRDLKDQGGEPEFACCLFPTAPFVTGDRLREAFELLENETDVDTVMPVVRFSYPPQRGMYIAEDRLRMCYPEHSRTRSQDLEPMYHDAGQFLCFRTSAFIESGDILKTRLAPLIISELEVQDIDDETDWILAEQKYRLLHPQV